MIVTEKNSFQSVIVNMLNELGYDKVEIVSGKAYDIVGVKDGKKYCFKCQYDIDAISEKKMQDLIDGTKGGEFDEIVFVTNSSFISSAKKLGEKEKIQLWDRNTVDRMYIGVREKISDIIIEEKKSHKGIFITLAAIVVLCAAAAAYYFFFR